MAQALKKADNVMFQSTQPELGDSRLELLRGLRQAQKTLDPKWFYDEQGSRLFDRITRLPEYYPTRTEIGILTDNRQAISRLCETGCVFIEPGSGSSEKVRLLLDELRPSAYVPVDISEEFLCDAALQLGREYPWLNIHAVCADFNHSWSFLDEVPEGKRVVFYPGSTIGNLEPQAAVAFLQRVRRILGEDGGALVGVDLHKSSPRLHAAYNDASGLTARFNLNVLERINAVLDANFDERLFSHRAFYNEQLQRVEMHLVSDKAQSVKCSGGDIEFAAGETIHTENSYKYTVDGFAQLAQSANLSLQQSWLDSESLFSVHYLSAV